MGVDTRWEEAKEDLVKDSMFFEQDTLVEKILNGLKVRGWSITYPQDWPDLCGNLRVILKKVLGIQFLMVIFMDNVKFMKDLHEEW